LSPAWQLMILTVILVVLIRGSRSIVQQVRQTRHFTRLFLPLRETPPLRLQPLLEAHGLSVEDVVYLNLTATHAFCLGFWQPRIWLTAGLVKLLTDEELAVVLAHEAYHCRQRDPLRLLISQALKAAFFFLPLVGDLAKFVELQQEIAADQATIRHLGDDLPLLCTLQKLLTQSIQGTSLLPPATFNPFNVTEARLRRLLYPSHSTSFNWRRVLTNWVINLSVVAMLGSIGFLSTQPVVEHREIGACAIEEVANPLQTQLALPKP
jgi:hypothetical protein